MENMLGLVKEDDQQEQIELPPGFRFHPTDEELISHYLHKKLIDISFFCSAIAEVDLNKSEPWELPWKAKMGEEEWYFFCLKDLKYPTGSRTNRATQSGYWKATGKDKEIFKEKSLVGMKKTLVFYRGRAPRGEKTNWVMHEYRLDGKLSPTHLHKTPKSEWVICRVFQKSTGGKRTHISGLMKQNPFGNGNGLGPNDLPPPLTDSSSTSHFLKEMKPVLDFAVESSYNYNVPCFSTNNNSSLAFSHRATTATTEQEGILDNYSSFLGFPRTSHSNSYYSNPAQIIPAVNPSSVLMQEHSALRGLMENIGSNIKTEKEWGMNFLQVSSLTNEISSFEDDGADDQEAPSAGPVALDSFWNY